jgi:hypothetical protein
MESRRLGHELAPFTQLDLLRVGKPLDGGLARRVAQMVPGFDTRGAHRAQKDALMTLALLEAQLPHISETELRASWRRLRRMTCAARGVVRDRNWTAAISHMATMPSHATEYL